MSNVMGIYGKFTKTTHQIWSCHVTLASNFENFYFSPNSILNFRKSYQIWVKLDQEQKKLQAKSKFGGGKHPLSPQCLQGKGGTIVLTTQNFDLG